MSKEAPVFEEIPEFSTIADKIVAKYPEEFGNVDLTTIACVGITNKDRPERKKQLWDIKPIRPPVDMYCKKQYIVIFFQKDWDELTEKKKSLIISDVLCSIPSGGGGEVIAMDYKDHSKMLRTFGVDYMDLEDDRAPDILDEEIEWKK